MTTQLSGGEAFLEELVDQIAPQELLNDRVYRAQERVDRLDWLSIGADYYLFSKWFPETLKLLAGRLSGTLKEGLNRLVDEERGKGPRPTLPHAELFLKFTEGLGISDAHVRSTPASSFTRHYVRWLRNCYSNEEIPFAVGVQFAFELAGDQLIEGFSALARKQEVEAAALEYFDLHIVDEKEHVKLMRECAMNVLAEREDWGLFRGGALVGSTYMKAFWSELWRQR